MGGELSGQGDKGDGSERGKEEWLNSFRLDKREIEGGWRKGRKKE